jgi:hypothetical protein
VSYRLHPHARWVASPPWVLERRDARPESGDRSGVHSRAAPSRAAQAEAGPASRGARAQCTGPSRRCGRGPRALCNWAERGFGQWHLIIFLYFLNIFNSLQIQKFV